MMERRTTAHPVRVEARAEGETPRIRGVAAVYYDGTENTEYRLWDGAVERIMPGAFDDVMDHDVRGLFNHDPNFVLGRTKADTLRLENGKDGLGYEIDPPKSAAASGVVELLERGDVDGSSFAFTVGEEEWREDDKRGLEIREVTRIRQLFDVGPVTYPAYEATSAGVRSAGEHAEARASYEAWKSQRKTENATAEREAFAKGARARIVELDLT